VKWGWLLDNLGLKLFALLLAVLLYLHVLTERAVEETVEFPLVVSGVADSLAIATTPPATIAARLSGTGKQILRLRYLRPPLELSLAGVGPGTFQRTIAPGDVPLAGATGVTVHEVEPARVSLEVTPREQRRVAVHVRTSGTPARGFVVGAETLVRPKSVVVSGPTPWLARLDTIFTEPVSVTGRRESLAVVQPIGKLPPYVRATPGSVFVAVPIEVEERREVRVPLEVRGVRSELRAEPQPASVVVTWHGPRSTAERIVPSAYRARVDAARRGRGEWLLPVLVDGPGLDGGGGRPAASAAPDSVRVVLH
jgi:hypothetical protein